MSVRSLSRALGTSAAAGALTLAMSGIASAVPARADTGDEVSTPVAAPKVAPPPTWPLNPQTLTPPRASSPSADPGFQWGDAGIGAGGALVVVLAGFGGAMAIRRRGLTDPPLPA